MKRKVFIMAESLTASSDKAIVLNFTESNIPRALLSEPIDHHVHTMPK